MELEIERKFLVKGEFKHLATRAVHMAQGYLCSASGRTVRVRICDDKAYLTIKGPSTNGGMTRYEFETEIPMDDAKELMKLCMPGRIIKDRWLVRSGKHVVEVDEFFGENRGLVIGEIELESEDEQYVKPDFLGEEVTGDHRYYNSHLMRRPYTTWER